jgi:hypothetical protein
MNSGLSNSFQRHLPGPASFLGQILTRHVQLLPRWHWQRSDPLTTTLYDRTGDEITLDEVEPAKGMLR